MLEIDALDGDDGQTARTKAQLWTKMGADLEAAGWPRSQIGTKVARTIEDRIEKRTGIKVAVKTAHYYRVMAENKWADPVRQSRAGGASGGGSGAPAEGAQKKPYISLERDDGSEAAAAEAEKANRTYNREFAAALRSYADVLRWAAKTVEDRTWHGATDLAAEHPAEYAEAVRSLTTAVSTLEEEGARRIRVPKSAHHLFRVIAGRGELSAVRASELFAAERLRLIKERGMQLGPAIIRQFRAGKGPDPPPILQPAGRDAALLHGWSGQQCTACRRWRVEAVETASLSEPDRICVDCGEQMHAVTPATCPECRSLVYGPAVQHGRIQGRLAVKCGECGHAIPVDKKTAEEVLAPAAR